MEVPTLSEIRDNLANMAAADAHHDFDKGERGAQKAFETVYLSRGHKDIGTPIQPSELLSEAKVLNAFLKFFSEGESSRAVEMFRAKFFRDDFAPTVMPRASDDPIGYTVKSLKISSRVSKSGNDVFNTSPAEFMDFLTEGTGRDVAFCIDAVSTSFYNVFKIPQSGFAKRTAYFVNPRESINDGAGKMDMTSDEMETESGEYSVKVRGLNDTFPGEVVYNATDLSLNNAETFFSVFNLALLPAGLYHGIPAIQTVYSKENYSEPPELIVQNGKDQNTVKALSNRIMSFLSGMAGEDYRPYYTMLQRKRSGDWLQVLSCLDRKRYPEMPDIPTILCTEDYICAAYAIAMGVDVIFTHVWREAGRTNNWLLYLRKNADGVVISEGERLARSIAALPKPDAPLPELLGGTYLEVRAGILQARSDAIGRLVPEFAPATAALAAATGAAVETAVKAVLSLYARLVWSRASLPLVEDRGEESLDSLSRISIYETQLSIFKKILRGKSGNLSEVIQAYVSGIVDRARGGPRMEEHIGNMSIFGSLMSMRRSRESGLKMHATALFTFFHNYLTEDERAELITVLRGPLANLTGDSLTKYTVFFDTTQLFIGKVGNGPKVPSWILVKAVVDDVFEGHVDIPDEPERPVEEEPAEEPEGVQTPVARGGALADSIELSSSYGPSVILALRFQNKQERAHRVEDLDARKHSSITTPILFLHRLIVAMEIIDKKKVADPSYECSSEFMLKYLSQWLIAILNGLPGISKKEYSEVECFLLGMVFQHESPIKESTDLIEFITGFARDVYGVALNDYVVRACPSVARTELVFQESMTYIATINQLKHIIHRLIGIQRKYEEESARRLTLSLEAPSLKRGVRAAVSKAVQRSKAPKTKGLNHRTTQRLYHDGFTAATRRLSAQARRFA